MCRKLAVLTAAAVLGTACVMFADFHYSETTQMTGGAMHSMMKVAGVFSKDARQGNAPSNSTIYLKGNRLRREESMGKVSIIDLDGRRMIEIDTNQHTYSVVTFEQMRLAMQQAQAQAQAKMAEERSKHPTSQEPPPNVKITPKVELTPTGATRNILNLPTKEVKMRMDMEMESTDPKTQGQKVTTWFTSDSWIAPEVPGYGELRDFYKRMAKEFDWMAATVFGSGSSMQMNTAGLSEFRRQSANMEGIPLVQYVSMGMGAPGQAGANAGAPPQGGQSSGASQQKPQVSPTDMMMPQVAVAKALGGRLFGHKKKQEDTSDTSQTGTAGGTPPPSASTPGSLMDMTIQVTSYSSDKLPASLFEIPAGYTQVQANLDAGDRGSRH